VTITVDINVLLDVFQKREPHHDASAQVLGLVVSGEIRGVFPAHGLTTLYYLVRKHGSRPDAETAMDEVLLHFQIGNLDTVGWQRARQLGLEDFEDAGVATIAAQSGSAFIVTRNVDDFRGSPVPAITPTDLLSQLSSPPMPADGQH
jgi:predicted nucleic acid-binding protein